MRKNDYPNKRFASALFFLALISFLSVPWYLHNATIYNLPMIQTTPVLILAACIAVLAAIWMIFPPDTARRAQLLKNINWAFFIFWIGVLLVIAVLHPTLELALCAAPGPILLLLIGRYNTLLSATASPLSKTAKQLEHPLYWTKRRIDVYKTCAIGLPILLPLVAGVLWGSAVGMDNEYGWIPPIMSCVVGLIFTLLFSPLFFIKQTSKPHIWQRLCRNYVIVLLQQGAYSYSLLDSPKTPPSGTLDKPGLPDLNRFKFWLSHPGVELTPDLCRKIDQVDTSKFDWQDPHQWPDLKDLPTKEII